MVERRRRGSDEGPTIVASGPPITIEQGHCASMGGEVSGIEELRQAVRERAERGADIVKIMTSGGAMTIGTDVLACQFTLPELRAVVEQAHTLGLAVTAHAHAVSAVEQCVAAGVDGIEHCSCLTATGIAIPPGLADRLAAAGTVVCPTLGNALGSEPPPRVKAILERLGLTLENRLAHVDNLYRAGVKLISGADSGISPGKPHGTLPESVIELGACGVPNDVALTSATSLAATACGIAHRTGRLQAGLDADLLIVDGDPVTDIRALRDVRAVVSRGRDVLPGVY